MLNQIARTLHRTESVRVNFYCRNGYSYNLKRVGQYETYVQTNIIFHYNDVTMSAVTSQITSLTIVYSTVYLVADQRKYQSLASQASVRGIHQWPVNSPHKGPVTGKMSPFDDVIIIYLWLSIRHIWHNLQRNAGPTGETMQPVC